MNEKLTVIKVLFRAPETLDLWGIPYDLRPGQTPRDLLRASTVPHPTRGFLTSIADWVWLGQPGWWGHLNVSEQAAITDYLKKHALLIPQNAPDYAVLPRTHVEPLTLTHTIKP